MPGTGAVAAVGDRNDRTDAKSAARTADDGSSSDTRRLTSIDDRMIQGNTAFAFALLRNTCGATAGEHFRLPLSVSVALAMTLTAPPGKQR